MEHLVSNTCILNCKYIHAMNIHLGNLFNFGNVLGALLLCKLADTFDSLQLCFLRILEKIT